MKRILVVDDDETVPSILEPYVEAEGLAMSWVKSGSEAIESVAQDAPGLVMLDLMMPRISGFETLKQLRSTSGVPVIIVSARDEEVDRILGLELGADDYITKPFNPRETVARVRAVLRRYEGPPDADPPTWPSDRDGSIVFGSLQLDRRNHRLVIDGCRISLTPTEFRIFETLCVNAGHTLTREQLANALQASGWDAYDRTLDSHIANLRKKIERDPSDPKLLVTAYGLGYRFDPPPWSSDATSSRGPGA